MSFKTAEFRVRIECDWPGYAKATRNLETDWADDVVLYKDYGNDDGVRFVDPRSGDALLGVYYSCCPELRVFNKKKGTMWTHAVACAYFSESMAKDWGDYVDVRTYGLRALEIQKRDPQQILEMLPGTFYEGPASKGFRCIQYSGKPSQNGDRFEIEWILDESKGLAVLSVREFLSRLSEKRQMVGEAVNDLTLADGIWWPSHTRIRIATTGIIHDIVFSRVQFNRREHKKVINADTLDIPVGAMVGRIGKSQPEYYLGKGESIDQGKWIETRDTLDLQPLRRFLAMTNELGKGDYPAWWRDETTFGLEDLTRNPDAWEAYVRRWVLKRTYNQKSRSATQLTPEQRAAAKGILEDCRRHATPIRSRIDKQLARIHSELAEAKAQLALADDKSRGELEKRVSILTAQSAQLENATEIIQIFEALKKRLNGLLTSEQIAPNVPVKSPKPPPGPVLYDK